MRTFFAGFTGLVAWLVLWIGLSLTWYALNNMPENIFFLSFISYLSSAMAAFIGFLLVQKIQPTYSQQTHHIGVAILALLWVGSAVFLAIDTSLFDTRLASLCAALIGIGSSWRLSS